MSAYSESWGDCEPTSPTDFNFKEVYSKNLDKCSGKKPWILAEELSNQIDFLYRNLFKAVFPGSVIRGDDLAKYCKLEYFAKKFICNNLLSGSEDKNTTKITAAFMTKFDLQLEELIAYYAMLDMKFLGV